MVEYRKLLERTDCECTEDTLMRRILLHAGHVMRVHNKRFPNIITIGEVVGEKISAE